MPISNVHPDPYFPNCEQVAFTRQAALQKENT